MFGRSISRQESSQACAGEAAVSVKDISTIVENLFILLGSILRAKPSRDSLLWRSTEGFPSGKMFTWDQHTGVYGAVGPRQAGRQAGFISSGQQNSVSSIHTMLAL